MCIHCSGLKCCSVFTVLHFVLPLHFYDPKRVIQQTYLNSGLALLSAVLLHGRYKVQATLHSPLLQLLLLGFPFAIPALQFICSMLCYIFDKVINLAATLQQHEGLFKKTLQPEEIVITHFV